MGDDVEFNPYYGVFPYRDFLKEEGIPVFEGYAVDCHTVPVEPWERLGGLGTYVHVAGKSDYLSAYVVEIPPGGELNPEQHMHDELIHVISGRGSTVIERPDGRRYSFEWGPSAIFAIPLNAKHQIFNGSGTEPARLAAVTDLPIIFNVFRNSNFIFDNPFQFPERMAAEKYFDGEGEFRQVKPGRHQWETNFVPELVNFELPPWVARGAAGNNIQFLLGDSSMHCHISQFFEGTYKKAHAHNAGAHIFCVTGEGYSLLWKEGENPVDTVRVDWKPGTLYARRTGRRTTSISTCRRGSRATSCSTSAARAIRCSSPRCGTTRTWTSPRRTAGCRSSTRMRIRVSTRSSSKSCRSAACDPACTSSSPPAHRVAAYPP